MKSATFSLAIATSLTLAGCGGTDPSSAPKPVAKPQPVAMPSAANTPSATPPPPSAASAAKAEIKAGTEDATKKEPGFGIDIGPINLDTISMALRQYVAGNQIDPAKLTEQDLQNLVKARYLPHLPPPPPGKKYVWNNMLQVSLADKK